MNECNSKVMKMREKKLRGKNPNCFTQKIDESKGNVPFYLDAKGRHVEG